MSKLKYAGLCAAGFFVNCVLVGILFMPCYIPFFNIQFLYIFIEIQAVVTASVLHGFFRRTISQKLKMKTVVYTLSANVLPHIISFVLLILSISGDSNTNGGYSGLAWFALILIISFEIFVSGIGGFLFHKNILRNI